jgi:hypothetical protein
VIASSVAWAKAGGVAVPSNPSDLNALTVDAGAPDMPMGGQAPEHGRQDAAQTGDTGSPAAAVDGSNQDSSLDAGVGVSAESPKADTLPTAGPAPPSPAPREEAASARAAGAEVAPDSGTGARRGLPLFGLNADAGVSGVLPDLGLLLSLRPARWVHGELGIGYNTIALGVRGGVTLINPKIVPLSLTLEGGHYFEGDANQVVHWFNSQIRDISSLRHFSYDYMNLLAGLAIERQHYAFYLRAGVTWMRTTVNNFAESVNEAAQVNLQADDPKISYRGPAAKLGLIVFP